MILTCPSCATRYHVDDASIGPNGRSVKCAACSHTWFCEGHLVLDRAAGLDAAGDGVRPAMASPPGALTREQVERMRRNASLGSIDRAPPPNVRAQQQERERQARLRGAIGAWGGAALALSATAGGAVVFREDVARIWPQSSSAFAAVGLDVNIFGLEFSDLVIERAYDGATPILIVSGAIRNIGGDTKPAPSIRFGLRDGEAKEVFDWVLTMEGKEIVPGATVQFSTTIDNPPPQAVDLEATFASAKQALESLEAQQHVTPPMPPEQGPLELDAGASDEPLGPAPDAPAPHSATETPPTHSPPTASAAPFVQEAPIRARPLEDLAPRLPLDGAPPPADRG